MKKLLIIALTLTTLSSCIVEIDLTPANIVVGEINEFETKEVISEIWSGNKLIYEEAVYHTYLEIPFINTGGQTAHNAYADIDFYDHGHFIRTLTIQLPRIRPNETYICEFETRFQSIYEYTDYEVFVFWD